MVRSRGRTTRVAREPGGRALRALVLALATVAITAAPVLAAAPVDGAASGGEKVKVLVGYERRPGAAAIDRLKGAGAKVRQRFDIVPAVAIEVPERALAAIRRQPGVRRVELDATIRAFDHGANTGDLEYENAWGVEHIGVPAAHAAGVTGTGVKVGVIDTGIDYVHDDPDDTPYVVDPEFLGNYQGGIDIYNNDLDPMDDNGHGTHVSGILAAEKNGYLVVGVAPAVDLYAIKILNANGEGEYSHLIAGLEWAVANNLDVVNMSLGAHEPSTLLADAVSEAHAQGLVMVAASGNVNPLNWYELFYGCPVAYPAAYPEVLSTTFTNDNDALTGYSCTGPEVDFTAPGDYIHSPVPIGSCMFCAPEGYSAQSGTSMASPHLAGLVALLLDAGLSDGGSTGFLDDAKQHLCATASTAFGVLSTPIPKTDPRYPKYFGCGVIDAAAAVLAIAPPVNQPPTAVDDSATTAAGTPVTIDVLANDTDPENDTLTLASVGGATSGSAVANADGTVTYTPNAGFDGTDSFPYTVSDGTGSDTGTVTVTVTPAPIPNRAPTPQADNATTPEDTAVTIAVLGNDIDPDGDVLTLAGVGAAANGTTAANPDGSVRYTPAANWSGSDSFSYTVSDGELTASATVSVTVTAVDDPPAATNRSASTTAPNPVAIQLAGSDIDSCELQFAIVDLPAGGGVGSLVNQACVPSGAGGSDTASVTYTPNAGFSGPDTFTYRVGDGTSWSAPATVTVTVAPAPPPPPTHHVGDLDGTSTTLSKSWTATVTIRIERGDHTAVQGATVSGSWSGAATGTGSCTTTAAGTCTVQRTGLAKRRTEITFTVTSVTLSGSTYQASANHDPETDSTGTAITVRRA